MSRLSDTIVFLIVFFAITPLTRADDVAPSIFSILIEEGVNVEADPQVVSFPFVKGVAASSQWMLWKGSEDAPVLGWDPQRSGVITSGEQLIGTWAFGGHQEPGGNKRAWRDGYEALVFLDENLDGKISGLELRGLVLWFDRNRNGVSDIGEIRPAGSVGITSLNVLPEQFDEPTNKRWSTHGFQRVKDGVTFTGLTASWTTRIESSEAEIRKVLKELPKPCPGNDSGDSRDCRPEASHQNLGSIETRYR